MTEEEKAELAAKEAEAKAKADAGAQDDDTTADKGKSDEESKQFEAKLAREREAREKAEAAAADTAFKLREERRKNKGEQDEDTDEEKPLTKSELQKLLAEEREANQKAAQEGETKKIVASLSDNATEQALILEVFKNRSWPAHLTLEEKLEEAHLIANKDRIYGENSELKRSLRNRNGVSKDSTTTRQDEPTGGQPKTPAAEAQEYARTGYTYNATAKRYEKKLPDGRLLVKVKTGGTQVVKA